MLCFWRVAHVQNGKGNTIILANKSVRGNWIGTHMSRITYQKRVKLAPIYFTHHEAEVVVVVASISLYQSPGSKFLWRCVCGGGGGTPRIVSNILSENTENRIYKDLVASTSTSEETLDG